MAEVVFEPHDIIVTGGCGFIGSNFVPREARGPRAHGRCRHRHRQDPHARGDLLAVLPADAPCKVLHRIVAGHAPEARTRCGVARPRARPAQLAKADILGIPKTPIGREGARIRSQWGQLMWRIRVIILLRTSHLACYATQQACWFLLTSSRLYLQVPKCRELL